MSTQAVFERAVKHHLPKAFITHLERIDEFNLGQVLTYHSKPHWWWPKSKELDYTGMPLESLLTEGELKSQYKFETKKDELFSATSDQSNKTVDLDLDLDADMKSAWLSLGGKLGGTGKKNVTLTVALGALNHIKSDLFEVLNGKGYTVDTNHPVVKEAMAKGGTLFVISAIYMSDKVEVKITEQESFKGGLTEDEGTDATAGGKGGSTSTSTKEGGVEKAAVAAVKDVVEGAEGVAKVNEDETAKGDADVSTNGFTISNRDVPSVVGFHVMEINITKTGQLVPTGKDGPHHYKIHFSHADTFFASPEKGGASKPPDDKEGGATKKGDDKEGGASNDKGEATASKPSND